MIKRPSPSIIIPFLALVLALGGAGYSATGGNFILGNSNVASTQTVLTAHINGPALRLENLGSPVNATALSLLVRNGHPPFTVSNAVKVTNLNADLLDGLTSTAFVQAAVGGWHFVGDPSEPAFQSGWDETTLVGYQRPGFRIDNNHVVHLTGVIDGGTIGAAAFTLPAAYCPAFNKEFATTTSSAFAKIIVGSSLFTCGVFVFNGINSDVSLDGISFPDATTDVLVAGP
jgi:hypothetical protein